MENIRSVALFAEEKQYAVLTKEEILGAIPDTDPFFIERDWQIACEYLAAFTDMDGRCRLPLDRELDGNTMNYAKMIAVFMIFTALMHQNLIHVLPPPVTFRAMPYIKSRLAVLQMDIAKYERMDGFVKRAAGLLSEPGDRSIDDIFAEIFSDPPSVRNFSVVAKPDKARYLPLFEMLYEKAQMCAAPDYASRAAEYIEALQED